MKTGYKSSVDQLLSEIAVAHSNHGFIAQEVMQPLGVNLPKGGYYVIGKGHLRQTDDARKQGDPSNKAGLQILGEETYAVGGHALHDVVTQEDRANFADSAIDPEADTTWALMQESKVNREIELAAKILATANYETNYSTTLTGTDQWSDYTNSTPTSDIDGAVQKIHSGAVPGPYSMLLGKAVYDKLKRHPDLLEHFKYTSGQSITAEMIAEYFDLRRVLIGEAVKNTAAENAADALSYVWGKNAVLFADPVSPGTKQATFGRMIHDKLFGNAPMWVRRWDFKEGGEGVVKIEVEMRYTFQFIAIDNLTDLDSVGGYLIAGAVA